MPITVSKVSTPSWVTIRCGWVNSTGRSALALASFMRTPCLPSALISLICSSSGFAEDSDSGLRWRRNEYRTSAEVKSLPLLQVTPSRNTKTHSVPSAFGSQDTASAGAGRPSLPSATSGL